MDYEKKYNHALEVVRELQKDWASTQNRAAREIELAFPELRESRLSHRVVIYSNGKQIDRIPLDDVREFTVCKDSEDLIVVELQNNTRTYGETIRFE